MPLTYLVSSSGAAVSVVDAITLYPALFLVEQSLLPLQLVNNFPPFVSHVYLRTLPCFQSRYTTALYFVFTGLVSVGFGNVAPNTDNEMIFAIAMMLLGCKSSSQTTTKVVPS